MESLIKPRPRHRPFDLLEESLALGFALLVPLGQHRKSVITLLVPNLPVRLQTSSIPRPVSRFCGRRAASEFLHGTSAVVEEVHPSSPVRKFTMGVAPVRS